MSVRPTGARVAAVALVADGAGWPSIVRLTALLNAGTCCIGRRRPGARQVASGASGNAHVLTDETFALSLAHFQRIGRTDVRGYWLAAGIDGLSWPIFTAVGVLAGQLILDPAALGLDVVFPAAMGGLAVKLAGSRPELAAAVAGAALAVVGGIVVGPAISIVAAGFLAPIAGLLIERHRAPGR